MTVICTNFVFYSSLLNVIEWLMLYRECIVRIEDRRLVGASLVSINPRNNVDDEVNGLYNGVGFAKLCLFINPSILTNFSSTI